MDTSIERLKLRVNRFENTLWETFIFRRISTDPSSPLLGVCSQRLLYGCTFVTRLGTRHTKTMDYNLGTLESMLLLLLLLYIDT